MDEEEYDFGGSIYEGAAGYDGFGEEPDPGPAPTDPPQGPPTQPDVPMGPPTQPMPPIQQPPPPEQPAPGVPWDMVSTVLSWAGGAALGYYGADRDEDRLKMAMVGAAATGVGGVFGALALGVYLSRQKGR